MGYPIRQDYIRFGNARTGTPILGPRFIVAHDTGNPGATAEDNRDYFNRVQPSASAHTFIDDNVILEIIPLNEKAWHVRYEVPKDNRMFGEDANDAAIGVELCWGGSIDFWEAYRRYVWYMAYLCRKFGLNPTKHIVAHSTLDPDRRTDPENALNRYGVSWYEFMDDVERAFQNDGKKVKGVEVVMLLQQGDRGPQVKKLQQDLIAAGYGKHMQPYGADGIFGDATEKAVREFQSDHGLKVDGIAGPKTLGKLKKVLRKDVAIFELGEKTYKIEEVK